MFRNVAWWKGLKEGETASQSLLSDGELDENFEKVVEWRMSDHDAKIFLDMTRMDKMITAVHGAIFGGFGFYASSRVPSLQRWKIVFTVLTTYLGLSTGSRVSTSRVKPLYLKDLEDRQLYFFMMPYNQARLTVPQNTALLTAFHRLSVNDPSPVNIVKDKDTHIENRENKKGGYKVILETGQNKSQ